MVASRGNNLGVETCELTEPFGRGGKMSREATRQVTQGATHPNPIKSNCWAYICCARQPDQNNIEQRVTNNQLTSGPCLALMTIQMSAYVDY